MDRGIKNYQLVIVAIIEQAIHDYISASRAIEEATDEKKIKKQKMRIEEIESFFYSEWGNFCTNNKGDYYLELIKKKINQDKKQRGI